MADVLAWLATLANIRGIDLEAAVAAEVRPGLPRLRGRPVRLRPGREAVKPDDRCRMPMTDDDRPMDHRASVIPRRPEGPATCDLVGDVGECGRCGASWRRWPARRGAARAAAEVEVENLRVGFAGGTQNNLFKVGHLDARLGPAPGGRRAVHRGDGGRRPRRRRDADVLPAGGRRRRRAERAGRRPTPGRARATPTFTIRLFDHRRAAGRAGGRRVERWRSSTRSRPDETLLLTLGKPQGVEQIPSLPGFNADKNGRAATRSSVARLDAAGGDAAGPLVRLRRGRRGRARHQRQRGDGRRWASGARRWSTGSRGAGTWSSPSAANWQAVRDSVLGPILPARADRPGAAHGARPEDARHRSPARPSRSRRRVAAAGAGHEARGGRGAGRQGARRAAATSRWSSAGPYGFGRVTLVGARRRPEAVRRLARPRPVLGPGARPPPPGGRPDGRRHAGRRRRPADLPVGRQRPRRPSSARPSSSSRASS